MHGEGPTGKLVAPFHQHRRCCMCCYLPQATTNSACYTKHTPSRTRLSPRADRGPTESCRVPAVSRNALAYAACSLAVEESRCSTALCLLVNAEGTKAEPRPVRRLPRRLRPTSYGRVLHCSTLLHALFAGAWYVWQMDAPAAPHTGGTLASVVARSGALINVHRAATAT